HETYVYNALKINASRIVFGFGTTMEKAKENVLAAKNLKIDSEPPSVTLKFIFNSKVQMAYLCAQQSLHKLFTTAEKEEGIFAGLYWFNQFWTRDELVSVGSLISMKEYKLAKKILMKNLKLIMDNGRLPNRNPPTQINNADSIGWLFKRFYDLFSVLTKKDPIEKHFSAKELREIKAGVEKAAHNIMKDYSKDNILIENNDQETWMDTKQAKRDGIRLEIQAFQLLMYKFLRIMSKITKDKTSLKYAEHKEQELKKKVREVFWNKSYLFDGKDDSTMRPNVFLACYVYPELLSRNEWIKCFDTMLPKIFTGIGLSSVDINDRRFHPEHTGEDDESYQNGDSWYWINNIAVICLYKLAKFRYAEYIHKMLWSSTKDILWQGIPGAASEITSAKKHEAFGCFCQAWSNATYIEMVRKLF
ncbi:hypothetical protein KY308_00725, partial [Candidatus Woesearchaeota archaeon]|nr:hypothetical protein [Candidatus Woesearchaeota archaeon]